MKGGGDRMKIKEHEFEITIHIKDNKIEKCRTQSFLGKSVWKKMKFKNGDRQQIVFPFNTIKGWMEFIAELRYR